MRQSLDWCAYIPNLTSTSGVRSKRTVQQAVALVKPAIPSTRSYKYQLALNDDPWGRQTPQLTDCRIILGAADRPCTWHHCKGSPSKETALPFCSAASHKVLRAQSISSARQRRSQESPRQRTKRGDVTRRVDRDGDLVRDEGDASEDGQGEGKTARRSYMRPDFGLQGLAASASLKSAGARALTVQERCTGGSRRAGSGRVASSTSCGLREEAYTEGAQESRRWSWSRAEPRRARRTQSAWIGAHVPTADFDVPRSTGCALA
ncbi:hypothetical protein K466DRAFT_412449 [Polyporus arcularius HHB13444]|uniref:Uncharacterized protein n=1 Tax=Polyporus arcularius HHB13444 TaxID=1314778 RepID=A0A5C3NUV6_9APHY|nr:hypothetical protein K466DRAFT_412449 [Polyporus arcularius HHB13444]